MRFEKRAVRRWICLCWMMMESFDAHALVYMFVSLVQNMILSALKTPNIPFCWSQVVTFIYKKKLNILHWDVEAGIFNCSFLYLKNTKYLKRKAYCIAGIWRSVVALPSSFCCHLACRLTAAHWHYLPFAHIFKGKIGSYY